MLYKIGKTAELYILIKKLPSEIIQAVEHIALTLDHEYGDDRDADQDDGGFILVAESIQDVQLIQEGYQDMEGGTPEQVNLLQSASPYIHALYLKNNEFGISVFVPLDVAPEYLRREVDNLGKV